MNKSKNDLFENNFENENNFKEVNFNEEMFQLSENENENSELKIGRLSSSGDTSNFKSCNSNR